MSETSDFQKLGFLPQAILLAGEPTFTPRGAIQFYQTERQVQPAGPFLK